MSDCIEWRGARDKDGYGKTRRNGKDVRAHRVSYEAARGPIPAGLCVLHRCDNPPCINPDHLFLGTIADNVRDMDRKGRRGTYDRKHEANPNNVLSMESVNEIRVAYLMGARNGRLAALFGVRTSTISEIVKGRIWVSR